LLFTGIGPINAQDSISNIQRYTPSVLLSKNQFEIKLFNNLYTQVAYFDQNGKKVNLSNRSTYFTDIIQFLYGASGRINVGMIAFLRSVRVDKVKSSPLSVLKFERSDDARTAFNFLGPFIRLNPFKSNKHLSFQSSFLFPTVSDQEGVIKGKPFLDFDKYYWWTQIFYDKMLPRHFVLFAETDIIFRIDKKEVFTKSFLYTPLKLFIGKFLGTGWGVYSMVEWAPFWGDKTLLEAFYLQLGIGTKYQLTSYLEAELLYTLFPIGKNAGAGQTYNLGLRFLR